jgi:hypothetical protein
MLGFVVEGVRAGGGVKAKGRGGTPIGVQVYSD